jgi:hypothetical protein
MITTAVTIAIIATMITSIGQLRHAERGGSWRCMCVHDMPDGRGGKIGCCDASWSTATWTYAAGVGVGCDCWYA